MQGAQVTPCSRVSQANVQYWWNRKAGVGITIPSCNGYTNLLAKGELEVVMKMAILKKLNNCSRKLCVWGERK